MADIVGAVARLLHRAQQEVVNEIFVHATPGELQGFGIPGRALIGFAQVEAKGGGEGKKLFCFLGIGLFVDAVEKGLLSLAGQGCHRLVGGEHELLDHLMGKGSHAP